MSISFQSTSTNNNNNNKAATENSAAFVTTSQMAIAVANVQQRPVNANGHIIIPPLLPNSALYQYNEQMVHMHELYEDQQASAPIAHHHHHHHRSQPEATGRSTDV